MTAILISQFLPALLHLCSGLPRLWRVHARQVTPCVRQRSWLTVHCYCMKKTRLYSPWVFRYLYYYNSTTYDRELFRGSVGINKAAGKIRNKHSENYKLLNTYENFKFLSTVATVKDSIENVTQVQVFLCTNSNN